MNSLQLSRMTLNCYYKNELQFAKDETSIGTIPLTSMTIDTDTSDPVSQKPYPIAMKHYQWVKDEIEKLLATMSFAPAAPAGQHLS